MTRSLPPLLSHSTSSATLIASAAFRIHPESHHFAQPALVTWPRPPGAPLPSTCGLQSLLPISLLCAFGFRGQPESVAARWARCGARGCREPAMPPALPCSKLLASSSCVLIQILKKRKSTIDGASRTLAIRGVGPWGRCFSACLPARTIPAPPPRAAPSLSPALCLPCRHPCLPSHASPSLYPAPWTPLA